MNAALSITSSINIFSAYVDEKMTGFSFVWIVVFSIYFFRDTKGKKKLSDFIIHKTKCLLIFFSVNLYSLFIGLSYFPIVISNFVFQHKYIYP